MAKEQTEKQEKNANPKKVRDPVRESRERNKDKRNALRRERRASDPEYAALDRARSAARYKDPEKRKDAIEASRQWRIANPERHKNNLLMINYGITLEKYNTMRSEQNYKCAICSIPETDTYRGLFVDHCHETKSVRGLLCRQCNIAIGIFDHSTESLSSAVKYLSRKTCVNDAQGFTVT